MRGIGSAWLCLAGVLMPAFGCGQSEGGSSGSAGQAMSGAGGATAGSSVGGANTAGAGTGVNAGMSAGGSASGSATGGSASGASANHAGAETGGGGTGTGLVDCDPKKILCRIVAPQCDGGEVPSVNGSCYGACVKIDRCACSDAAQCPNPNEYTCWAKTHCGPFVQ